MMADDLRNEKLRQANSAYHTLRLKMAQEFLLPKAELGELWAIQNMLLLVGEAIRDECILPPSIAEYISTALIDIYTGKNADDAFLIKRRRGERDTRRSRARNYSIADSIERERIHRQQTLEVAIELVAQSFNVSPDTAKKAWKENHKEVKRIINLEQSHFGRVLDIDYRPGEFNKRLYSEGVLK